MRFLQSCVYSLDVMIYFRESNDNEKQRKILSILLIPFGIVRYLWIAVRARLETVDTKKCAVVLIIKNEGQYIREYIEYYISLGCDLIIYDNDSTDESFKLIKEYSQVKYIPWHGKKRQIDAYNEACKKYRKEYKYLCFFDADEFIVADKILEGNSLCEIIDSFFCTKKRVACLGINWLIFGSAGWIENPGKDVIDAFTKCANDEFEWNQLIKSCVDPRKIVGWVNPHLPLQVFGYKKINLDGKKIIQPRNDLPERKDVRLHHYFVKNKKHFEEKVNKGMADRNANRTMDEFYYYDKNDCFNERAVIIRDYLREEMK